MLIPFLFDYERVIDKRSIVTVKKRERIKSNGWPSCRVTPQGYDSRDENHFPVNLIRSSRRSRRREERRRVVASADGRRNTNKEKKAGRPA